MYEDMYDELMDIFNIEKDSAEHEKLKDICFGEIEETENED